jgi:serine protease Do
MRALESSAMKRAWLSATILLLASVVAGLSRLSGPTAASAATRPSVVAGNEEKKKADVPALPNPAPADRKKLPDALGKPGPVSIQDFRSIEKHVKGLVSNVSPAVVAVEIGMASGSGVVISSDGLVLTAGHVVDRPNRPVHLTFPNGKSVRGRTLGADLDADTGLLRITDPGPWPHVPVGELGQARIGDWVLALGHPGGFDLKRSLVVRLGRIIRLAPGVVQSDCTISPGDSGGPLVDMFGRVIGIHSAISASFADNFHVPITEVSETWNELVAPARSPAYLGATLVDDPPGCRLTSIENDGPAAKAGLKVGDRVLKVDGREILASASLDRWLSETDPGETLNLEIKRGDKVMPLAVKLGAPLDK